MGIHVALMLLLSLISDNRIMSDFNLVIPYIFSLWFMLPMFDILSELQFMLDTEILGNSSACNLNSHRGRIPLQLSERV